MQLADKAIKDRLSRVLVIFGACAGICYNGLWYFPVLIFSGGIVTSIWDTRLRQHVACLRRRLNERRSRREPAAEEAGNDAVQSIELTSPAREASSTVQRRVAGTETPLVDAPPSGQGETSNLRAVVVDAPSTDMRSHGVSIPIGLWIIGIFFGTSIPLLLIPCRVDSSLASFIAILVIRGQLNSPPRPLDLFTNMYLAGTIIFGGGPVVIPLLREYVVQPGWVSSRDFFIGLAIIQAFPGPNFNFGVYLGALALLNTAQPTIIGAALGYIGIFLPGLALAMGVQGIWRVLRTKAAVVGFLRGVNATAVGLVFTAVYRLWQIGYLTPEATQGQSLAKEPWWVVVCVLSYSVSAWFHMPAAAAIVLGGLLGLAWYGAVGRDILG